MTAKRWIDTNGGHHLLIAEEFLPSWRGIEGWRDHIDPDDPSDYARACRVNGWLGVLPCGRGEALVLGGDVGSVAWFPETHGGGILAQWGYADDAQRVEDALRNLEITDLFSQPDTEVATFATGPSGALRLFDSAEPGDEILGESEIVKLEPSLYQARAAYFKLPSMALILRQLLRIERG